LTPNRPRPPRTTPAHTTPARTGRAPRRTGAHGTGPRTVGDGAGAGGEQVRDRSDHAEGDHRVGHLAEARHIGAHHVVAGATHLLGGLQAARVDALHDLGEALLGVLEAPGVAA